MAIRTRQRKTRGSIRSGAKGAINPIGRPRRSTKHRPGRSKPGQTGSRRKMGRR